MKKEKLVKYVPPPSPTNIIELTCTPIPIKVYRTKIKILALKKLFTLKIRCNTSKICVAKIAFMTN